MNNKLYQVIYLVSLIYEFQDLELLKDLIKRH